jgi:hypothetical protein
MFFSHRQHNAAAEKAVRLLPIRSSYAEAPGRPHPWQIRPQWVARSAEPGGGYWAGSFVPGLVNGQPPAIRMPFVDAPPAAFARVLKEREAAKRAKPKPDERVDVFLDEDAFLKFPWRAIGSDAAPAGSATGNADTGSIVASFEPVPDFFKRRGVASANPNLVGAVPETQRYLRACDIVLNQPRVGFANEITVGAVVDGSILAANPSFVTPPDQQPRVTAVPKFVQATPPTLNDFLVQRFTDAPLDQVLLATVYALSPAFVPDPVVTSAWTIFVRQHVHWNLSHAGQRIRPRTELPRITFFTPLAGGVANLIIAQVLAENNDFSQALLDMYQQTRLAGMFYAV